MKDVIADDLRRQTDAARDLIAALQSDDAELIHDSVEGETSFLEAIDRALSEIDECEMIVTGCKAKEEELSERRTRAQRRRETIRGLIEQAMLVADIRTVRRPTGTLTVKDVAPKPIITDEAQVPSKFWRTPDPVLDKAAINEAIKADETIPGVSMSNGGTSLVIRRA